MINIAHIHPMVVHFPLALLPVAIGAQAVAIAKGSSLFGRTCVARTAMGLLALAAVGSILAAIFGDMALDKAIESGVALSRMEGHEELGKLSAGLVTGLALAVGWFYYKVADSRALSLTALVAGLIILALLVTTAWFGGQLVYEVGVNVARGG